MCSCGWLCCYLLLFEVEQRSGVLLWLVILLTLLFEVQQRSGVMLWLVILLTITVCGSTEEWCDVVVGYIFNNYCLSLNRGVVCCCGWLYC